MKYSEILSEVKDLYPNDYKDSQYVKWLLELENKIAIAKGLGVKQSLDLEKETSVGVPFDRMYVDYVMAQVSLHQHDDESYARYMSMFNDRFGEWQAYHIRTTPGKKLVFKNWI